MHHFPHIYVMQQRQQAMMMQQQHQQQQQMMMQQGGGGGIPKANDIESLKASGVLSMLSSPEGRLKVQELATRVQSCKTRLEEDISAWTQEKKQDYFSSFGEHPALAKLTSVSAADPLAKINTFVEMSDSDLEQMMTLLLVVGSDPSLVAKMANGGGENASAMAGIMTTMGSLSNLRTQSQTQQSSGHSHDGHSHNTHDHSHDHNGACQHHAPYVARKDISSGQADTMDR